MSPPPPLPPEPLNAPAKTATLLVELGGYGPGSQYDVLDISGTVCLGGTLEAELLRGFLPRPGDEFSVMTFSSREGRFDAYAGLDLGGGLYLRPRYTDTSLTLLAVPEPSTLALAVPAALALLGCAWRKRRKKGEPR